MTPMMDQTAVGPVRKSIQVEIRFTAQADGTTRVDLEHRCFERHGTAGAAVSGYMDAPNAWAATLEVYGATVDKTGLKQEGML